MQLRFAGPMVTASAVKAPAPYVIDPWAVGMTYPDVSVAVGQGVEFKWPGMATASTHGHTTLISVAALSTRLREMWERLSKVPINRAPVVCREAWSVHAPKPDMPRCL